jgi:hypothetical protein
MSRCLTQASSEVVALSSIAAGPFRRRFSVARVQSVNVVGPYSHLAITIRQNNQPMIHDVDALAWQIKCDFIEYNVVVERCDDNLFEIVLLSLL